jgi:ubiquinol-cytochrome c reductase cytochrome c subunit
MMRSLLVAMLAAVSFTPLLAQTPKATADAAPPGSADNGKKLYVTEGCWACHNLEAQGGAGGPRLSGRTPAWAPFLKYVRYPTDEMPPYTAKAISDQELADIYAWLKAIPPPPPVSSIPELKGSPKN